jgi:hypothetical protein
MLVKEPGVPDGWSYPFPRRGDAKEPKTLEICQSVSDYAVMTFIDGGRCTTVPVRSTCSYEPPTSFPACHEMGLKVDPMDLALNQVNIQDDDSDDEVLCDMGRGKKGRKSEESASSAGSTKSGGNKKRKSENSAGSSASVKGKKSKSKSKK